MCRSRARRRDLDGHVYSRNSAAGGTTGPVVFTASVARYQKFGHVSPSKLTLAPGQTGTVTLETSTPAEPGDQAGSIVLASNRGPAFGRVSSVPVTLRSLMPSGPESFTETLTGGNGRGIISGEAFLYSSTWHRAPAAERGGDARQDPDDTFDAWLVSPSGKALAFASNQLPAGNGLVDGARRPGCTCSRRPPVAGR